ncbi:MAG: proteasome subunit beta [Candidatus Micrarchaeia archaeon]
MDIREIADKVLKGTTTVGIVCQDGVVMGADSRATADTFIASSEAIKVYKIDDTLGMTIAGSVSYAEYIVKFLKVQNELYKMNEGKPLTPAAASSLLSLVLQENANSFAIQFNIVQLIIGGLNKGAPELYDIDPLGGSIKDSKFFSSGSGSLTALGYLESIYTPDILVEDAVKHTVKALKIAMKRDSATGDSIKVVAVTKKGFKEYTKEELDKIAK